MGKLTLHLSAEDRVLYPELTTHADPHVAKLAQRFAAEMKTTATQVMAYNDRWATPSSIKADSQGFIKETQQVLAVLSDRIKRENQELYAAADKVQGQTFG